MADATLSRLGIEDATSNGSWDQDNALFDEVFAGEILAAFSETNVFQPLHLTRRISSGKSAAFPATWKFTARYHTPGTPILGDNQMETKERVIKVDDLLIADTVIYDLDEMKAHYDLRQEHSRQLGAALAKQYDQHVAQVIVNAARASGTTSSSPGGSALTNAAAKTDGEVLASMIFSAAQTLDEKDIPEGDRYVAVKPAQYYLMAQTTKLLNRDWGGSGVYAEGEVLKVAGISIVKSNNIPTTNIAASVSGENNDYTGNFTKTAGVVFTRYAAGTVELMGLQTEMSGPDFHIMYQADLMLAKFALGHGILRPECAIELATP